MKQSLQKLSGLLKLISVSVAGIIFLYSCYEYTSDPDTTSYLVSYKKVHSLQKPLIMGTLALAQTSNPEIEALMDNSQYAVDVYEVHYNTIYNENEIIASGLVCIPKAPEKFPLLSFQNGTNAGHSEAPSQNSLSSMFLLLQSLAGNGYIILIPDYIGFGTSEHIPHPYYHKKSSTDAVIHLMYATRELIDNYEDEALYSNSCFLMGYSMGGWASLSSLKALEEQPDSPFQVVATSCGAGGYNLVDVAEYILDLDSLPSPFYLPLYLYSRVQMGEIPDTLGKFFLDPFPDIIPQLMDGSLSNSEIDENLSPYTEVFVQPEFRTNLHGEEYSELIKDYRKNSIHAWNTNSLILFFHGKEDKNIPVSQSESIYSEFADLGLASSVQLALRDSLAHKSGVLSWGIESFLWFNSLKEQN